MCGIFGFAGDAKIMNKTLAKLVLNRIKILGIYNIDRGKHSCGIYINDQIIKGVDTEKVFSDFIAKKYLPLATETGNYTVIGHTRQATVGDHTAANAHPFLVDDNLVLAHNGGIKNIWELCRKYGVDYTDIHVDSLGLAHLIAQEGFDILSEYKGFAALLMAFKDTPNVLHFYRGVSKRFQMAQNWEEERPLYYLQTEEGIYLSSIEKSLQAISDSDDDEVQIVPANTVFTIENGRVCENKKVPIDRSTANWGLYQNITTCDPKQVGASSNQSTTATTPATATTAGTVGTSASGSRKIDFDKIVPVIWHETLPGRATRWKYNDGLFYHRGRHWIAVNDVFKLANGALYANQKGRIMPERRPNRFFIDGIMMKNKKAYEMAKVDPEIANPNWNYMLYMSKYSEYPVCATRKDIHEKCKDVPPFNKYRWFENQAQVGNKSFTPLFSDRHYVIKDGLLDSISAQKNFEKEDLIDIETLSAERRAIEQIRSEQAAKVMQMAVGQHRGTAVEKAVADAVRIADFLQEKRKQANELPFEDNKVKVFKGDDLDVTSFYIPFSTIEQAEAIFTLEEQRAIRYFLADIIHKDGLCKVYNVYEESVDLQFKMFLQMCIDNDATVADNWKPDEFADIPTYLATAKNNKDGSYSDFIDNEEVEDDNFCCSFEPKPEKKRVEGIQEGWFEVGTLPDDISDEEPPFMDLIYEKEKKKFKEAMGISVLEEELNQVPTEEDEEDYGFRYQQSYKPVPNIANTFDDDVQEKEIAFEEALDALLKARDEADAFAANVNDDFSQHMANALYRGIDPMLKKFEELTAQFKETNSQNFLKRNIKERVKS